MSESVNGIRSGQNEVAPPIRGATILHAWRHVAGRASPPEAHRSAPQHAGEQLPQLCSTQMSDRSCGRDEGLLAQAKPSRHGETLEEMNRLFVLGQAHA
jgi:hypothetical protein